MIRNKQNIEKILVITLSNIGDVVLTTPILKNLYTNFPSANITVMCSQRTSSIFLSDPKIKEVIKYDKHSCLSNKLSLALKLRQKRFDIVIDLRHTLFPLLLASKYRTSFIKIKNKSLDIHKRDFHLQRLKELKLDINITREMPYIYIPEDVKMQVDSILRKYDINESTYVVISPGGRDKLKLWSKEKFLKLSKTLMDDDIKVLLVGDEADSKITSWIARKTNKNIIDLAGKTSLLQLAEVLRRAKGLVTNDSGTLHIAGAVGVGIVAIFGPTNELNYGPLGENDKAIKSKIDCRPCIYAKCEDKRVCLDDISVRDVYEALMSVLKK